MADPLQYLQKALCRPCGQRFLVYVGFGGGGMSVDSVLDDAMVAETQNLLAQWFVLHEATTSKPAGVRTRVTATSIFLHHALWRPPGRCGLQRAWKQHVNQNWRRKAVSSLLFWLDWCVLLLTGAEPGGAA